MRGDKYWHYTSLRRYLYYFFLRHCNPKYFEPNIPHNNTQHYPVSLSHVKRPAVVATSCWRILHSVAMTLWDLIWVDLMWCYVMWWIVIRIVDDPLSIPHSTHYSAPHYHRCHTTTHCINLLSNMSHRNNEWKVDAGKSKIGIENRMDGMSVLSEGHLKVLSCPPHFNFHFHQCLRSFKIFTTLTLPWDSSVEQSHQSGSGFTGWETVQSIDSFLCVEFC